jgi:hypothetical protein
MATVTLRLTPQRAHVRTARLVAAAMARRSGVPEELLDEVRLAVGEACGRAVQLHERHGLNDAVVVTLADDDRFEVTVQDAAPSKGHPGDGHPYDGDGSARLDGRAAVGNGDDRGTSQAWEEPLNAGLGLALLDALVEDITVDATDDDHGTRVRMSWPIALPPADGSDRLATNPAT